MNARTLLDNFDLIADAPGGVPKLRELILQLAVRGKLVPQDPKEESAELLLKRMGNERLRLQKERVARELNEEWRVDSCKISHDLPLGWRWVPLAVVFYPISPSDKKVKSRDVSEQGLYPVVDQGKSLIAGYVDDETKVIKLQGPVVVFGDHTRAVKFIDFDFVPGADGTKILRPILIDERYFVTVLRSFSLDDRGYGRHYKVLMSQMFPLPPLPEQKRIMTKVDELMNRCDELDTRQKDRAARHKTLVASCLNAFSDPKCDPEFIIHHSTFNILFTSPESIAELRKTILQFAVQGRLVSQDPKDQRAELVFASRITMSPSSNGGGVVPFELPINWQWIRLGQVGDLINGDRSKNYPNKVEYVKEGVPWINTGHIEPDGTLSVDSMHHITRKKFDSLRSGKVRPGDLVYCLRGATLGKTAIITQFDEGAVASSLVIIRLSTVVEPRFAYLYLTSPLGRDQIFKFDNGSAQPNLSANNVRKYWFPLPPLAEQKRIVAKVNELMVMCDELEAKLTQSNAVAEKLAEAVVHQTAL